MKMNFKQRIAHLAQEQENLLQLPNQIINQETDYTIDTKTLF